VAFMHSRRPTRMARPIARQPSKARTAESRTWRQAPWPARMRAASTESTRFWDGAQSLMVAGFPVQRRRPGIAPRTNGQSLGAYFQGCGDGHVARGWRVDFLKCYHHITSPTKSWCRPHKSCRHHRAP
jgi:hypothetical protein